MIGVRLTKDSGGRLDMLMENGRFVMAENGTAAASAAALAVVEERIECEQSPIVDTTLNPYAGVDYYGIIFDSSKGRAEKELELRRAILSVPGIEKILRFQWVQNGRTVNVNIDIKTQWGNESVSQEVTQL